jgi:hypothetical protein
MKGSSLNIILIGAAIIVIALWLTRGVEKYKPGTYIARPEENGFIRPLWGKDMPVQTKEMSEQRYNTFGSLPQCTPPHPITQRCFQNVEVPYSYNKI